MKKSIYACIILTITLASIFIGCTKSGIPNYHTQGVITFSPGCCLMCECASAASYSIKFNRDTTTLYSISNDLSKFGINANCHFPLNVVVSWEPDQTNKGGNYVIITQLQIIN